MYDRFLPVRYMKNLLLIPAAVLVLSACDARVTPASSEPEKVVEKNTTVVNPPAKEEKKVENNTTIVNPPADAHVEEKKKTTTTTTEEK